jgi:hypothetical protein
MYVVYYDINMSFNRHSDWDVKDINHYPNFKLLFNESVLMVPGTVSVDD